MKIHILFGLRKQSYPGQYAPEALEVMDEYAMDDNLDYLKDKSEEYKKSDEFQSLRIFEIKVDQNRILDVLIGHEVPKVASELLR